MSKTTTALGFVAVLLAFPGCHDDDKKQGLGEICIFDEHCESGVCGPQKRCVPAAGGDQCTPTDDPVAMGKKAACTLPDKGVCAGKAVPGKCVSGKIQCDPAGIPGYQATESLCDGKDNDCDGEVDEGLGVGEACDGDDADKCADGVKACAENGQVVCQENTEPKVEICDGVDNDCDGVVDNGFGVGEACDGDDADQCADGVKACDEAGGVVCQESGEGKVEICDGVDNDCDGETDEGFEVGKACDGDDEDSCENGLTKCSADGTGVVCDETGNAVEICDGVDNDCDGETDEGFDLGTACDGEDADQCKNGETVCNAAGDGVTCQETGGTVAEVCDGVDNDCDGETDEGFEVGAACDGDDSDSCPNGTTICNQAGDGVTCQEFGAPKVEVCDNEDNDCDGETDEGFGVGVACDGDDADSCQNGSTVCDEAGTGVVCVETGEPAVELCDGADNDCDGETDEGFDVGAACDGDDADQCQNGTLACNEAHDGVVCVETGDPVVEICDGADNDCDGQTDEDFELGVACDGPDSDQCANGVTVCNGAKDGVECGTETVTDIAEVCGDDVDNNCDGQLNEGCPTTFDVCGTVVEVDGGPIAEATVSISGGTADNVLGSASTDAQGHYCITGVSGAFLGNGGYIATAKAADYQTETKTSAAGDFTVVLGTEVTVDFALLPQPPTGVCLAEGFEDPQLIFEFWSTSQAASASAWGLHMNGDVLVNTASGVCTQPPAGESCTPGDPGCPLCVVASDLGCVPQVGALPNPYTGAYAMWFGNETANYLDGVVSCSNANGGDGGLGVQASQSLTSPSFTLSPSEGATTLRFRAWFEIESVDPQAPNNSGYDQMRIEVLHGEGQTTLVGWLNPDVDVNGATYQPYTSGGFDQPAIWGLYEFDLSQFNGQSIQVQFTFDSVDGSYNGFRGWMIDEVEVTGDACPLPPQGIDVCGQVDWSDLGGIAGATVSIAGGTSDNILASATTDLDGRYCINGVSESFLTNGGYFMTAKAEGYDSQAKSSGAGDFTLVPGQPNTVNFNLSKTQPVAVCLSEGFEDEGVTGVWTVIGSSQTTTWEWHQSQVLVDTSVGVCTTLPPDETCTAGDPGCPLCVNPTDPACIPVPGSVPNAYAGSHAYRFGNAAGNYLEGAGAICEANNGGTFGDAVTSSLTSPPATTVQGGSVLLRFQSWFEIESTDPQAPGNGGFDQMRVEVVLPSGQVDLVGWLNPDVDVNGANNEPYSSGGHNKAGVWALYEFDLSAYAGQTFQVRFTFDTKDGSYNGFRGWLIDDVNLTGTACVPPPTKICGTVYETSPGGTLPLAFASVTLAGGSTSNVIAGVTAGEDGTYCFDDVPSQFQGQYFVTAGLEGYASQTQSEGNGDFVVTSGATATVDFLLSASTAGVCFSDDFEGEIGWSISEPMFGVGWNLRQNGILLNAAVGVCADLSAVEAACASPDCGICLDPTSPGCIPAIGSVGNAFSGQHAFWFGNPTAGSLSTGNYLGEGGVCGGLDSGPGIISGTLTSQPFFLPTTQDPIMLQFRSWFEIESVDPQAPPSGFDAMLVHAVASDGTFLGTVGYVNPDIDANGGDAQPYSSGGFLAMPVWNLYEFDLSAYAGQTIRLQFEFNTVDASYNVFRGWLVDDVTVESIGCNPQ